MALIACKDCKTEISSSAKSCPKCGAKLPTSSAKVFLYVLGIAVAVFLAVVFLQPKSIEEKRLRHSLDKLNKQLVEN